MLWASSRAEEGLETSRAVRRWTADRRDERHGRLSATLSARTFQTGGAGKQGDRIMAGTWLTRQPRAVGLRCSNR